MTHPHRATDRTRVENLPSQSPPAHVPGWRRAVSSLASAPKQLGIRLLIWSLHLLQRTVNNYWIQQVALRPVAVMLSYWVILRIAREAYKTGTIEGIDSKAAEMLANVKTGWNTRLSTPDRANGQEAMGQAMTWGLAGVAVVLLATIVAYRMPGTAVHIAAGCFALATPILLAFGLLSALGPPTVKAAVFVHAPVQFAQQIVGVGFAAFLWSYHPWISAIFMMGCGVAWRLFQKIHADHFGPAPDPRGITPSGQAPPL